MNRVAILQSNYIPWKGYFDIINSVDVFIIYDEMQYTKNDWRNRNKIKTANGTIWLTMPVVKGKLSQKINETLVSKADWNITHWNTLKMAYSKAPFFSVYKAQFEDLFIKQLDQEYNVSAINVKIIRFINNILGINTKVILDSELGLIEGKSERLVDLCKKANGELYLSGPAAKGYLNESLFEKAGIQVKWMDYSGYPEYSQLYPPFEHGVSVLDLIFNTGPQASSYMKSFN